MYGIKGELSAREFNNNDNDNDDDVNSNNNNKVDSNKILVSIKEIIANR